MAYDGRRVWSTADTAGTPRTRALAGALRQVRIEANFGTRELARRLGMSHSTVSQWETGKRVPCVEDVSALLGSLGVTGLKRKEILDLARHASEPNWLEVNVPGMSQQLAGIMDCERTAKKIMNWAPLTLPGLLQTSNYSRAIFSKDRNITDEEVEARITLRMGRRDVLDRHDPVELVALIGEWALRERVGGEEVMADQLRFLVMAAQWPAITVRVVRAGGDWNPGFQGSFLIFEFAHVPSMVYLEHHRSGVFVDDEDAVAAFQEAANTLQNLAMSQEESVRFIADLMDEMESSR